MHLEAFLSAVWNSRKCCRKVAFLCIAPVVLQLSDKLARTPLPSLLLPAFPAGSPDILPHLSQSLQLSQATASQYF